MPYSRLGAARVSALLPGAPVPDDVHQVWLLDGAAAPPVWRLDAMLEPGTRQMWQYRRDPRLSRPRPQAILLTASGIPYLAPDLVLLFKAKARRDKDNADFHKALPRLSAPAREQLRAGLQATHPDHPWIADLAKGAHGL